MAINRGLGGPKAMEKSEADGQLVNIPVRQHTTDERTDEIKRNGLMIFHCWLKDRCTGKSVQLTLMWNPEQTVGRVLTLPSLSKSVPRKISKG